MPSPSAWAVILPMVAAGPLKVTECHGAVSVHACEQLELNFIAAGFFDDDLVAFGQTRQSQALGRPDHDRQLPLEQRQRGGYAVGAFERKFCRELCGFIGELGVVVHGVHYHWPELGRCAFLGKNWGNDTEQ